jgi:hypothetical protein
MTRSLPLVVCVIVTYKSKELTLDCVRSLLQSRGVRLRIVIVDNASGDGSADFLRNALHEATVVVSDVNRGYTGGNNLGLRHVGDADFAFVLNNDTLVDPDCLMKLVAEADRDPAVAMVNPCIFYHEPRDLLWFGGSRFSLWTGRATHVGRKRPFAMGLQAACDIPFATGCALLLRMSALRDIGELDESLFGYAEDLDWSLRARRAGYRLRYQPEAVLWHREGIGYVHAGGQGLRYYLSTRNLLLVLARNARWYHWMTLLPTYLVDCVARFATVSLVHADWKGFVATFRGLWHALTGGRHAIEPVPQGRAV